MTLFQSLSFRLTLIYIGLFCASVAVLIGLYFWVSVVQPTDRIKAQVDREARILSQLYIVDGQEALVAALQERAASKSTRMAFHAFIDGQGRTITANLPSWPRETSPGWVEIEADIYSDGDEADHNALVRDIVFKDGARLLVGRDSEDVDDREEMVATAAIWIICGTILLGVAGGLLMSRAIRTRIDAVNLAARTVMEGDFSGRVPVRGTNDDFDRLGETLNLMLSRIEELFESVRRVSDTVAHELRTPLSRLLVQLEGLETEETRGEDSRALVEEALDEARRLQRIFDALLRIARIEGQRHLAGMRETDISQLANDVVEFHEPAAVRRSIALETSIEPQLRAYVDPDLLFQALSNLLDNALKYTQSGGAIRVAAHEDGEKLILSVSDNGPGLAPEEATYVTERFYRGASAQGLPGEGLGLSLVAAIVWQHGAELRFGDNEPGVRVELAIPRMRSRRPEYD